jgi:hypothetical protein
MCVYIFGPGSEARAGSSCTSGGVHDSVLPQSIRRVLSFQQQQAQSLLPSQLPVGQAEAAESMPPGSEEPGTAWYGMARHGLHAEPGPAGALVRPPNLPTFVPIMAPEYEERRSMPARSPDTSWSGGGVGPTAAASTPSAPSSQAVVE